jgi:hypothetical protein
MAGIKPGSKSQVRTSTSIIKGDATPRRSVAGKTGAREFLHFGCNGLKTKSPL